MLAEKHCTACVPGTPTLSPDKAKELMRQIDPAWVLEADHITRTVSTASFAEAFSLATPVALLAERQGHHPDLTVKWGCLKIRLKTHVADGLTENDFIMASGIDRIIEE